jgi:hypothetical protein
MQAVTLPILLRAGAREFCWVTPDERLGAGWEPAKFGAFVYAMAGGPPISFALTDPAVVREEQAKTMAKLKSLQQMHSERTSQVELTERSYFSKKLMEAGPQECSSELDKASFAAAPLAAAAKAARKESAGSADSAAKGGCCEVM